MHRFCLIGYPLGHSISPQIHRRLFELSGIDGCYELHEVAPGTLKESIPALRGYDGFNITIPYKQQIIPLLDGLSSGAAVYGAVNTVVCRDGTLTGYNTDAEGFLRALADADIHLSGRVLLCGTGGVAHMAAVEALRHSCALTVASRNPVKSATFTADLSRSFPQCHLENRPLSDPGAGYNLIVNGTPAGMYPHPEGCPVPAAALDGSKAVFDAVYNPLETVFLKEARARGLKAQGGLSMLVWQAAAAETLWTDAHFTSGQIARICGEMADTLAADFPDVR